VASRTTLLGGEHFPERLRKSHTINFTIKKQNRRATVLDYRNMEEAFCCPVPLTPYIECWMTGKQIKKLIAAGDSRKAFYSEYK
tara:strand:+ start:76 stop:327 length:252 start_codon:yes stop_codon:yes gene_type:complete